jgi:hypothetical protein
VVDKVSATAPLNQKKACTGCSAQAFFHTNLTAASHAIYTLHRPWHSQKKTNVPSTIATKTADSTDAYLAAA